MAWAEPASWRNQGGDGTTGTVAAVPEPPIDLVVVGAGAAGLFASLTAARRGARVTLVSARPLAETASYWAQGGLAAALAEDDSPAQHLADTLTAGRGLTRRSAAEVLCEEAPARFADLEGLGVRFDADRHGNLALGLEGGHGIRRVVHAGGSATGRRILRQLSACVVEDERITVLEGRRVRALLAAGDGRVGGVACDDGRTIAARAVILASGGAAALWSRTTNPPGSYGSGLLLARAAGAELADLEFAQFHPTAVVGIAGREGFLVSEAVRGEGATLHDAAGERFVDELQPRDAVARAIHRLLVETGAPAVYLDMTAIDPARFPNVVAALREAGHDPATQRIPVSPASHYVMGGITSDLDGRSTVAGPLRRRGVRLHRPARREPARLQLAVGVLRVRAPRRARRARRAARPASCSRRRTAISRRRRPARRARRCGATPAWSAPPPACAACSRTSTRSPASWRPRRSRARRAAGRTRGPTSPPRTPRSTTVTASSPPAPRRPRSSSGRERSALNANST